MDKVTIEQNDLICLLIGNGNRRRPCRRLYGSLPAR